MSLTSGTRLGPYEVVAPLGSGGMGEVYRARDTRLGREVAVKVLPAHLSSAPEVRARFEREARTVSSLNHPNICTLHDVGREGDTDYLVMELIEGESLAQRLAKGALPLGDVLRFGAQIADALDRAHRAGVVHRDLKPGNVMLTRGGTKLMDFGLARATATAGSPGAHGPMPATLTHSPTVAAPLTAEGAIVGTFQYMAPEQLEGLEADARSDIWALGCVLYEMATGRRAFEGSSQASLIGSIMKDEPRPLAERAPTSPPALERLVKECLAKDRDERRQSAGDLRRELEWLAADSARSASGVSPAPAVGRTPAGRGRSAQVARWGAAALLMIALGWLLAARFAPRPPARAGTTSLAIPSRTATYQQASNTVISPDGRAVVFLARATERDEIGLWLRPLDSFEARALPETRGARRPFWSWDSRSVAFHAEGKLWALDLEQGGTRRLIAAEASNYGATWGPGGEIILARTTGMSRLVRIPPGGGAVEPLPGPPPGPIETAHLWPRFLPDGSHYLFVEVGFDPGAEVRAGTLYAARIGSPDRVRIASLLSSVWYAEPGWLVFVEDGVVKRLPFDAARLRAKGEAEVVADGAYYFKPYGLSDLSVSTTGTIAFEPGAEGGRLTWFDESGARLGTIGPRGGSQTFRISPDGTQVAADVSDRRTGVSDLWLFGTGRATSSRLTSDARWEAHPVWSRDGSTIYFSWDKSAGPEIYAVRADGSGPIETVYGPGSGGVIWQVADTSPDGTALLVNGTFEKLGRELRIVPLADPGQATPFRSTPAHESFGRFSPDGRWIAYASSESGRSEVYLAPYPGAGRPIQVSESGTQPVWSRRGDRLYYRRRLAPAGEDTAASGGSALMVVDLDSAGAPAAPPPPRLLFEVPEAITDFDVSADGKRFLLGLESTDTPPMHIILNGLPAQP